MMLQELVNAADERDLSTDGIKLVGHCVDEQFSQRRYCTGSKEMEFVELMKLSPYSVFISGLGERSTRRARQIFGHQGSIFCRQTLYFLSDPQGKLFKCEFLGTSKDLLDISCAMDEVGVDVAQAHTDGFTIVDFLSIDTC